MTIKELLKINYPRLKDNHLINEPVLEAEILLGFILKKSRSFIVSHSELEVKPLLAQKFTDLIKKRSTNYPIAYLIGQQEFYGLKFKVSDQTLIPRPETEILVEEIIKTANNIKGQLTIIDVGTGPGTIVITLAKKIKQANAKFIGIDVSKPALEIAKLNAKTQKQTKIKFIESNLLKEILNAKTSFKNQSLIIAANLPYLTPKQIKNSPTIAAEPRLALDGGSDGLKYYYYLCQQIKKLNAKKITLFCEIDPDQILLFSRLVRKFLNPLSLEFKKDLSGNNRIAVIHVN